MVTTVFPYPGSKSHLASWIIEHMPQHTTYIEPFGGSAAVLVNKPKSKVEIYNDIDGDIYHFFSVLREQGDELVEYLRNVQYSEELHYEWRDAYYNGYRPSDDVTRAAQFFYLRQTQFACKYDGPSGFSVSTPVSESVKFKNSAENLTDFRDRLRDVSVVNRDYGKVVEKHDTPESLFYFDPPYVDIGNELYSQDHPFDHERFVEILDGIEGKFIVSYGEDTPPGLAEYTEIVRGTRHRIMSGKVDDEEGTERLIMNFNPEETEMLANPDQHQLSSFGEE